MTANVRRYLPVLWALGALVFVAALLAHEYVNGGVRSHYLMDRPDLPALSNWLGLVVLPVLGWALGVRLRKCAGVAGRAAVPTGVWVGLVGALVYGAALATAFTLGSQSVTLGLFLALFVVAAALPIYRIECIFGFVVGMALTFGAVLPTLIAALFALVSAALRFGFVVLMSAVRPPAGPSGAA